MELGKLAIDYSDGIIETGDNVNKDLLKYASENKKPMLQQPKTAEEVKEKYTEFYNNFIE